MLDATAQRTDVQSGAPAPKVQTEPPKEDGIILIDPTRKYMLNKSRPDQVVFGEELLNRAGRGQLFDRAQSESQKKDGLIADLSKQLNDAMERLKVIEREQSIRKIMGDMGVNQSPTQRQPNPQTQDTGSPGDDLLLQLGMDPSAQTGTPGQDNQPQMTSAQAILSMRKFFADQMGEIEENLKKGIQTELSKYIEGREVQDSYKNFLSGQSDVLASSLRAKYPDLDAESIQNIVDLTKQSTYLASAALDAAKDGDHDTARELFTKRDAFDAERTRLEARAMAYQSAAEKRKELSEILEAEAQSMVAQGDDKPRKPIHKTEDAREQHQKSYEEAVKLAQLREQMNRL